ncbi:MAG: DNA repair protein RecN, partial [Oscillospiraceae bacterium]
LKEYSDCYSEYHRLFKRLEELTFDENEKKSKLENYKYQIDEIASASLRKGEEEELISRKNIIKNSKNLFISLSGAKVVLAGDDEAEGVVTQLQEAETFIGDCCEYIPEMSDMCKKITDYRYELDEIAETVRKYLDSLSFDENELEDIEERLDLIFKMKKKYGNTIEEIIKYSEKIEEEYSKLSDNENIIRELNTELTKFENKTKNLAQKLTSAREKASNRFSNTVESELKTLDMPYVKLIVAIKPTLISKNGADDLEFLISTNAGEEPRPLSKVASGGEMSRIMLAIKNVISANDDINTLIFDEIDAGISGSAAQKVGKKLLEVSQGRQVICVTHLAQVAAFADTHLLILKKTV